MKNGFTITQRNAVVEQHLWCIDTIMAQYAAWMQTAPIDPDDVYQSLAVRLIRAVNSYDPCKGYLKEYILSQLKREMVRVRSAQAVYGLTQAPANIGSTIVPLTIAAQRESYWETYIAVTGTLSRLSMPKEMPLLMFMMRWTVLPVIPTRRAIPSPSGMTTREIRLPLLTVTAIPPAIPTMD